MTTYRTRNSVYEVDEEAKRVRRLEGGGPGGARFGEDGVWRDYDTIIHTEMGSLLIYWPGGDGDVFRQEMTLTSKAEVAQP